MQVRKRRMNQDATYWPPTEADRYGNMEFGDAEAVKVRWQDEAQVLRDTDGREFASSAVIYVDKVVEVQGVIALGDHTAEDDPANVEGAFEIRRVGQSPALQRDEKLIKVWV